MSEDWNTKYGPRRVRRDPPTLEEAIFAAVGITDDQEAQAEIAASLMGMPFDTVLAEVKKLARASGNKTVELLPVEKMERMTGYVKGGCSPFGMKRALPTFVDASAAGKPRLFCSAGRRGVQVVLAGDVLIAASGATAADIVEEFSRRAADGNRRPLENPRAAVARGTEE